MALIVSFQNMSDLAGTSNYKVDVWINQTHIAGPFEVKNHKRSNGWQVLVKQFAEQIEIENFLS